MPIRFDVPLAPIFQRTGRVVHTQNVGAQLRPTAFGSADYGLLMCWPHTVNWLRVQATALGPPPREFVGTDPEFHAVCRRYRTTPEQLCPPGRPTYFRDHFVCIQAVSRSETLALEFTVDTDAKEFVQMAQQRRAAGADELVVDIKVVAFDGRSDELLNEQGVIRLSLRPIRLVPEYEGSVALDLGNTSSSIACLPRGKDHTEELRVLQADGERNRLVPNSSAVLSHVRIDTIKTWVADPPPSPGVLHTRRFPSRPHDDMPQAVNWVIGSLAATGTTKGLILGAKRLVSSRAWEEAQRVLVAHVQFNTSPPRTQDEQIDLINRVPAELLACRLLQDFTRASHDGTNTPAGWPRHLALTYPTTYSPQEIDRLRRTVYRAWLRLQFLCQRQESAAEREALRRAYPIDPQVERVAEKLQKRLISRDGGAPEDDPLIRLMLDEATAAAFFFLYRKALESSGGLAAFNYHYPDGLNLLLYDCGGGTTDIALVTAEIDKTDSACLRIRVRGRTGVRYFGGDNITRAVCQLLKAKLARELARERGLERIPSPPTFDPPGTIEERLTIRPNLVQFLEAMQSFDAEPEPLLPTRFDPHRIDDKSNIRREHTNTLWNWGESLKYHLEANETATLADIGVLLRPRQSKLADALLLGPGRGPEDPAVLELGEQLQRIAVFRWEVDALVGPTIMRSVRNCNGLIREHLGTPPEGRERSGDPTDEGFVHWVITSGNGARYPLVQEALRQRLAVLGLDQEGRFDHDSVNLKHAVAKGAALALGVIRGQGAFRVEFDSELSKCLPFDVGYSNRRINEQETLFRQGGLYDKLGKKEVPLAALSGQGANAANRQLREFTLLRRFPGDGEGGDPGEDELGGPVHRRGWSDYVTYRFDDGIQGNLIVSYDKESHQFVVLDSITGNPGKPLEAGPEEEYRSPPQRGDL